MSTGFLVSCEDDYKTWHIFVHTQVPTHSPSVTFLHIYGDANLGSSSEGTTAGLGGQALKLTCSAHADFPLYNSFI